MADIKDKEKFYYFKDPITGRVIEQTHDIAPLNSENSQMYAQIDGKDVMLEPDAFNESTLDGVDSKYHAGLRESHRYISIFAKEAEMQKRGITVIVKHGKMTPWSKSNKPAFTKYVAELLEVK